MVVVDTNVLAYLLIEGDRTREAQSLFALDSDWRSDTFLPIEFSNIIATYIRLKALNPSQGRSLLAEAEKRMRQTVNVPHARALDIAAQFTVSAYDARFLGAAQSLRAKLVTEDSKLRAAAPALTVSIADALTE